MITRTISSIFLRVQLRFYSYLVLYVILVYLLFPSLSEEITLADLYNDPIQWVLHEGLVRLMKKSFSEDI